MAEFNGNTIPGPSLVIGNYGNDDELLFSTQGFSQKGVTLLQGQGVLPLGTALGRQTSTKLYAKWTSGASDGTQNFSGILRQTTDTGAAVGAFTAPVQANIVIRGILKYLAVSSANGGTTSLTTNVAGSRVDAVLGSFTF